MSSQEEKSDLAPPARLLIAIKRLLKRSFSKEGGDAELLLRIAAELSDESIEYVAKSGRVLFLLRWI